jgi:lysophospholipase L1-like esterase
MLLRDWHIVCSLNLVRRLSMRRSILGFVVATTILALSITTSFITAAQQGAAGAGAPAAGAGRGGGARGPAAPATVPFENPNNAMRHQGFVDIAKKGKIDLLFVGDSITDFWRNGPRGGATGSAPYAGLAVWDETFGKLNAANFGISGDTTQGVLWRMQNGELEGFKAKLIVLMLGTNNINRNPNDDIVEGDHLIVEEFKKRQPQAKVLILGIFPRTASASDPIRATIKEINGKLATFADNKQVFYMDIGDRLLAADGTLTAEIMSDGLHPTTKGYQIWADATLPRVKELMGVK